MSENTIKIGNVLVQRDLVRGVQRDGSTYEVKLSDGTNIRFDAQNKDKMPQIKKHSDVIDFTGFNDLSVYGTNGDNSYSFEKCTDVYVNADEGKDEIRVSECKEFCVTSKGKDSKVDIARSTKGDVSLWGDNAKIKVSSSKSMDLYAADYNSNSSIVAWDSENLELHANDQIAVDNVKNATIWGSKDTHICPVAFLSTGDNSNTIEEWTPDLENAVIVNIPEKNVHVKDMSNIKYQRK